MSWGKIAQVHGGNCAVFDPESKRLMIKCNTLAKPTRQQKEQIVIQVLKKFCKNINELEWFKGWKRIYQFPKDRSMAIFNGKTIKKQHGCSANLKKVTEKEKDEIINFVLTYGNISF